MKITRADHHVFYDTPILSVKPTLEEYELLLKECGRIHYLYGVKARPADVLNVLFRRHVTDLQMLPRDSNDATVWKHEVMRDQLELTFFANLDRHTE